MTRKKNKHKCKSLRGGTTWQSLSDEEKTFFKPQAVEKRLLQRNLQIATSLKGDSQ
jgi:hypothetical protein